MLEQDYLKPSHAIDNIELLPLKTREARKSIMNLKISSSLSPAMKALFGPGLLFNSIKSGLAVDYPIFKKHSNINNSWGNGVSICFVSITYFCFRNNEYSGKYK